MPRRSQIPRWRVPHETEPPPGFPARLSQAANFRSTSITKVALSLNINRRDASRYLHGENLPTVATLLRIAKALNVSIDWLLDHAGDIPPADTPTTIARFRKGPTQ